MFLEKIKSIFKKEKIFEESTFNVLDSNSSFEIKEAYNTLTTNVMYLPITDKCKKIAITSAVYGEGKTSVAINLAIALSSNLVDKKILLVDADMRNPSVEKFLCGVVNPVENNVGLSEYLEKEDDELSIVKSHIENLDVVYSGNRPINPARLLNSEKMNRFLSKCEAEYDYIIIDTPPVNVVSDAVLFIGRVNGYLIATKSKVSTVPMLSSASETLNSMGATVYGAVFSEN